MKQVKIKLPLRALTLASGLLLTASSFAQSGAIKGQVKDASGEPVMGATITAKRVCHKSVTHPFLFFSFSQIRNL